MYKKIDWLNITILSNAGKIGFDYITVDWCVVFKSNEITTLHSISVVNMF